MENAPPKKEVDLTKNSEKQSRKKEEDIAIPSFPNGFPVWPHLLLETRIHHKLTGYFQYGLPCAFS